MEEKEGGHFIPPKWWDCEPKGINAEGQCFDPQTQSCWYGNGFKGYKPGPCIKGGPFDPTGHGVVCDEYNPWGPICFDRDLKMCFIKKHGEPVYVPCDIDSAFWATAEAGEYICYPEKKLCQWTDPLNPNYGQCFQFDYEHNRIVPLPGCTPPPDPTSWSAIFWDIVLSPFFFSYVGTILVIRYAIRGDALTIADNYLWRSVKKVIGWK